MTDQTDVRRCVCGEGLVPWGEIAVRVADTVHRVGGPCYVDDQADVVTRARAALDVITPGPWKIGPGWCYSSSQIISASGEVVICDQDEQGSESWERDEDATFIAAAPDLVRDLADEVERLAAERDDWCYGCSVPSATCGDARRESNGRTKCCPECNHDVTARLRAERDQWEDRAGQAGWELIETRSELDQARAAIVRVRALRDDLIADCCVSCGSVSGGVTLADAIRAALDGEA